MSKIDELITKYCPNGVEHRQLGEVAGYSETRIDASELDATNFVGVDNLLANAGGKTNANYLPNTSRLTAYQVDDVLLGNIRPYLKKVWFADNSGGCSGDVLAVRIAKEYQSRLLPKLLYYQLSSDKFFAYNMQHAKGAKMPRGSKDDILRYRIPLPPLEIQHEIVKVLDTFSALEAELEAELEARRRQYAYYRDALLSFDEDALSSGSKVKYMKLGDVAIFRRGSFPQPYGESKWYNGKDSMPFVQVVDVKENMRLAENTKSKISILAQPKSVFVPKGTVIVTLQGSIGRVAITQYDCYVDRTLAIFSEYKMDINPKYFAYQIQAKFSVEKESARGSTIKTITKEEFTQFKIPVPSIEEQNRVVSILDKFDALVNDISEGLPAEIAARRQQYEYYRDKLLTFKEAA